MRTQKNTRSVVKSERASECSREPTPESRKGEGGWGFPRAK
jgi:hypothetical protein